MSDDEPEPPKKRRFRLSEDEEFAAEFEAELEQALDEAFGPARRRPLPASHWPELSARISDAAVMHELDPETQALEKIGRFEGLATIGEGGFGTVFKVRDPDLDRIVALKLCRTGRPGADRALLEEAKILANIKHPNIITAHEVGRYADAIFLVTEHVHGLNMFEYAVEDPLRWEVVLELFISVGETLADAHDAGVIHGDLKPENMLVEFETKATFLVDFGLARIMSPTPEQLARDPGMLGTLYYMAPELLRGGRGDRLSDQYAFAVSLWQSLEGRVPYIGDSEGLLEAIEYGEPMRWRPDVPLRVYEVIRKGFSEKREDRYPDMRTFVRELGLARGPRPVPKQRDEVELSPAEEAVEERRLLGKKGVVFGLALLLTGTGVLGELYLARRLPQPDAPPPQQVELRPAAAAVRGFQDAHELLQTGDVRACYERWRTAKMTLSGQDPRLAAELSMVLAAEIAARYPGRTAAAWIAVGASESFLDAKDEAAARKARERAAQLYEDAGTPDAAAALRGEIEQPDGYSSQPTVPSGSE